MQRDLSLSRGGKKKSLLIGINYIGQDAELKGCINDVRNVREFLVKCVGFPEDPASMTILTEEAQAKPVKSNMTAAFQWLVSGTTPGDSLFLHYSGHGSRVKDPTGDREDGMEDTIVPLDYKTAGQIDSDLLHHILVDSLPKGVRLTCIFDCCHSGTALELPYTYRTDEQGNVKRFNLLGEGKHLLSSGMHLIHGGIHKENYKEKFGEARQLFGDLKSFVDNIKTPESLAGGLMSSLGGGDGDGGGGGSGGEQIGDLHHETFGAGEEKEVYLFSGCKDDQTSADAMIQGVGNGAMSYAMLTTLNANPKQSYKDILLTCRKFMEGKYSQIPQLSVGFKEANLDQPIQF